MILKIVKANPKTNQCHVGTRVIPHTPSISLSQPPRLLQKAYYKSLFCDTAKNNQPTRLLPPPPPHMITIYCYCCCYSHYYCLSCFMTRKHTLKRASLPLTRAYSRWNVRINVERCVSTLERAYPRWNVCLHDVMQLETLWCATILCSAHSSPKILNLRRRNANRSLSSKWTGWDERWGSGVRSGRCLGRITCSTASSVCGGGGGGCRWISMVFRWCDNTCCVLVVDLVD